MIGSDDDEFADLQRRRENAKQKLEQASKNAKEYFGDVDKDSVMSEFKELSTSLLDKLELLSKLSGEYTVTYPLIRERKGQFRLVSIKPKEGKEIVPNLKDRLTQPFAHNLLEITDWPDYQGVEANISYTVRSKKTVRHLVFNPIKNRTCSIKTVTVLWFNEGDNSFRTGMGLLHLRNDVEDEQIFELPFVETRSLRLVVNENWGDPKETCFEGVKIYQT